MIQIPTEVQEYNCIYISNKLCILSLKFTTLR